VLLTFRCWTDFQLWPEFLRNLVEPDHTCRHIIAFLGYGYWEFRTKTTAKQGSLFIVEELVDGGSLKNMVVAQMHDNSQRHYRTADALRWLRQIAQGLAYLHRSRPQVIHRDLKLDNVLMQGGLARVGTDAHSKLAALVRRSERKRSQQPLPTGELLCGFCANAGKDVTQSEAKIADFGLSAIVRCTTVYTNMEKQVLA
jgi:serine/threonine protein kinase